MASMPLQFPDLAAEALEDGIKRLGFKGGGISAGWAGRQEPYRPEYDVFWSKVQELGAFMFMHPGGTNGQRRSALRRQGRAAEYHRQPARDDDLLLTLDL
jgi:predicted TIM-barrel fold metal-dependent hydrolase